MTFRCVPINFTAFVNYCSKFLLIYLALDSSLLFIQGCKLLSNVWICPTSLGKLRKVDLSISNHSKAVIKI